MVDVATTARRQARPQIRLLAIVLHPASETDAARRVIRAWEPMVPRCHIVPVVADPHDAQAVTGRLHALVHGNGPGPSRTILAGVCGAADLALRFGFGPGALAYAGVLACGPMPLPISAFAKGSGATTGGASHGTTTRVRLVWTSRDPLRASAALGALLRCLRAAGLDAQGAVLDGSEAAQVGGEGGDRTRPVIRLGGAYLAEFVAVALEPSPGSPIFASESGTRA